MSLASRGYEVVAVELGAGLAQVARRKLAPFPAATVVDAAFEAWPLPAEPFDAVFAATSFHWIDPDVPVAKSADEASGSFGAVAFRRYEHERSYSAQEYRDLLLSYSGHRAMEPAAREGLLACISRLIDESYGGRITKRYMNELAVGYKS